MIPFGECIHFIPPSRATDSHKNGLAAKWHDGIFLGIRDSSNEYWVGTGRGVTKVKSIHRRPEAEKWNKELLAAVNITPRSLHQPRETEVIFKDKVEAEGKEFADGTILSRQVYLRASDFAEHGFTRACPKCNQFLRRGDWKLTSGPHSADLQESDPG